MDETTAKCLAKEAEELCYAEMEGELRNAWSRGCSEGLVWGVTIGGLVCGVAVPLAILLAKRVFS